jgi:hypothetical protein
MFNYFAQAPADLSPLWELFFILAGLMVIGVMFAVLAAIPIVILSFFGFDPLGIQKLIGRGRS